MRGNATVWSISLNIFNYPNYCEIAYILKVAKFEEVLFILTHTLTGLYDTCSLKDRQNFLKLFLKGMAYILSSTIDSHALRSVKKWKKICSPPQGIHYPGLYLALSTAGLYLALQALSRIISILLRPEGVLSSLIFFEGLKHSVNCLKNNTVNRG